MKEETLKSDVNDEAADVRKYNRHARKATSPPMKQALSSIGLDEAKHYNILRSALNGLRQVKRMRGES